VGGVFLLCYKVAPADFLTPPTLTTGLFIDGYWSYWSMLKYTQNLRHCTP
jgi:hypothetical protein